MTVSLPLKHRFELPEDLIYLDGNSLGPLPVGAVKRTRHVMQNEWGKELIKAWNTAEWMDLPRKVADKIAPVIGAPSGTVATGDTLSIKVYQALAAALKMRPERKVILSDTGNFPTDLYMAQGLIDTIGKNHELKLVEPEEVIAALQDDVAVLMLTHVDYRTGRLHDMKAITAAAQNIGAVVIWDLAHSAGALPVNISDSNAEFAVGCTYKYLNGGPGAPAFIYVRPDLILDLEPALAGWLGHEAPFAMEPEYRPAMSTERLRIGTPSVIQLSILDEALNLWENIDLSEIRQTSIKLSELFIEKVTEQCPALKLMSPREPYKRGSQVSFSFEHGYQAVKALIDLGVIGDFRSPDIMRFGFTPLYLDENDVIEAAKRLCRVIHEKLWQDPKYQTVSRVT